MVKSIVTGLVVLAIIITCGVLEVVFISKDYNELHTECEKVLELTEQETLTLEQFNQFRDKWYHLRETSEIFLPHMDVYEINLRFAESQAYAEQGDYAQLYAQLCVVEELLRYIPHLMTPNWEHII